MFLFQIFSVLQPDSGPGVTRDQQQETQNRLESGLHPVFKIENLQPGTQFRAVVFAKVRNTINIINFFGRKSHSTIG